MENQTPLKTKFGYEVTLTKTEKYEAKFIVFDDANSRTDMISNTGKDKSWFVNSGSVKVRWIDTSEGKVYEKQLDESQTFHVPKTMPTQIIALTKGCSITEVSNVDSDDSQLTIMDSSMLG